MTAPDWIWIITLGALMGAVGQGVRVIVGLKKTSDEAATLGHKLADQIEPARLVISLLIGAVAGVIAAVATISLGAQVSRETLLGLAAAGYSGADFVEGFAARYLPSGQVQAAASAGARGVPPPQLTPPAAAGTAVLLQPAAAGANG